VRNPQAAFTLLHFFFIKHIEQWSRNWIRFIFALATEGSMKVFLGQKLPIVFTSFVSYASRVTNSSA
jgi:hypothetical protein